MRLTPPGVRWARAGGRGARAMDGPLRYQPPAVGGTAPGAPAAPGVSAAGQALTVTWSAPASPGSSAVSSWRLRHSADGGTTWTTIPGVTSPATLSGLAPATTYAVQVAARNATGWGPWSASGTGTTAATVPAAPAAPAVTTAGAGAVGVSWSAPASTGGSPVTGHDLRHSADGGSTWTTVSGVSAPAALSGLAAGTAYQVQVRAINAVGAGAWSASGAATTETGAAAPPPWVALDAATYLRNVPMPNTHTATWATRIRFPAGVNLTEYPILPNVRLFGGFATDRQLYFAAGNTAYAMVSEKIIDAHVAPGDELAIMIAISTAGLSGGGVAAVYVDGAEAWRGTGSSAQPIGYAWGAGHAYVYASGSGQAMIGQVQALWATAAAALDPATHWGAFFGAGNAWIPPGPGGAVAGVTPVIYQAGNAAAWNSGVGVVGSYTMIGAATDV